MDIKVILHPTDGSKSADKALDFACDLAASKQARLIVLHVQRHHGSERVPMELEEYARLEHVRETESKILHAAAENIARHAGQKARTKGIDQVEELVVEGDPVHQIIEAARKHKVDAIVMGSRGLGDLEGLLLGSVSHKIASSAPCSCVIVR